MKKFYFTLIMVLGFGSVNGVISGTAYIPLWQHGGGVTYYNNIVNADTKSIFAELNLIDVMTSTTYTISQTIAPGEAWITDTAGFGGGGYPPLAFGWGYVTSTGGAPGTTYGFGSVYGTLSGKILGLTIPIRETGIIGTGYIPMWQYGGGMSYFNTMVNTDTKDVTAEINLIDVLSSTTYTISESIPAGDVWIYNTTLSTVSYGYGWGFMTSTGTPGTTFAYGAIWGTLSGKLTTLSVIIPETGF